MFMDSCTGHCILKQRLEKKLQVILLHSLLHATWIAGVQQLQRGSHVFFFVFWYYFHSRTDLWPSKHLFCYDSRPSLTSGPGSELIKVFHAQLSGA